MYVLFYKINIHVLNELHFSGELIKKNYDMKKKKNFYKVYYIKFVF